MKPMPLLRRMTAAALAVVLAGAAWAQQASPASPPRGGAQGGIGIQVDLGALLRAITARRPAGQEDAYVPGQIVGVWEADEPLDAQTIASAAGARLLDVRRLEALALVLVVLEVPEDQTDAALQTLRQRHPAAVFDRQVVYTAASKRDDARDRPLRYAARLLHAPEEGVKLPAPVVIGIVDGQPDPAVGLEAESIALLPLVKAPAAVEHATAVACLLACAAETGAPGLARGAGLVFAAVLANGPAGRARSDTSTVALALDALAGRQVDLVHMSLGGAPDAVLTRVVERVLSKVRGLIAAGGNSGPEGTAPFPASHPGVIAVAAVDADAKPWRGGTRGPHIAIAAPGVDLWLPVGGGRYFTGTSYAAPFVTAALAWRLATRLPARIDALCAQARDLSPAGPDPATGCGLLQWPRVEEKYLRGD